MAGDGRLRIRQVRCTLTAPTTSPKHPPRTLPDVVADLLGASPSREHAWARFLEAFSPLILRAIHTLGDDADARMDRYAFVLDQLRADDYRRVRAYADDGRAKFTTWLVVVVQRLCLDERRRRHGRLQGDDPAARARHEMRQRLLALVGDDVAVADHVAGDSTDPDIAVRSQELHDALARAVAALESRDRLILKLRFEDDESVPTIARIVGATSVGHTYRRIDAILAELRTSLIRTGVRDSQP